MGLNRRPYFVSRVQMEKQLEALQAYSERRMAHNQCRIPQDSRLAAGAAQPRQASPCLQQDPAPPPPAWPGGGSPPLPHPRQQPAKGGAWRSRGCFASDYTPPMGDALQGSAFALRVR